MNWILRRLTVWLLGPASVNGVTDERMDGLTLAIQEEAARLGVKCAHLFENVPTTSTHLIVRCAHCDETRINDTFAAPVDNWRGPCA